MLVSIIIPTYNRASRLKRAIFSVLSQQNIEQIELIVVDDGSTDDTREMIMSINDPRLIYLYQENRGVSSARNRGIRQSRGELIALLDSDDIWKQNKLSLHLKFHLEGQWEISQTQEEWILHGKRINPGLKHKKKAGWIFIPSLELCLISPSCVMFSRRLWEEMGPFDESLPACEDYDLWLRVTAHYPVGLFPVALVEKYGGHLDQLSRRIIGLDLYRIYALLKIYRQPLPQEYKDAVIKQIKQKGKIYITGCIKRGKWEEAERIRQLIRNITGLTI